VKLLGSIRPKTKGQNLLLKTLSDDNVDIVGVFGPSGTGKSLINRRLKDFLKELRWKEQDLPP